MVGSSARRDGEEPLRAAAFEIVNVAREVWKELVGFKNNSDKKCFLGKAFLSFFFFFFSFLPLKIIRNSVVLLRRSDQNFLTCSRGAELPDPMLGRFPTSAPLCCGGNVPPHVGSHRHGKGFC